MIARKSALIVGIHILNAIFGYVALFFISRNIGPWDYGVVGFALGFVMLFNFLGNLGYDHAHIKKVSEGKNLGKCIGTIFTVRMGLMGLMASAVIGTIVFWKFILGRGFETPTHELAVYIILVYCSLSILTNTILSTFKAKREIAKAEIPLFAEVLTRTIGTVYIAILGYGAIALAFTYVVGWIASLVTSLYFFRGYPIKKTDNDYIKDYSKFAFPLILVVVCSTIIINIDKVLIQLFWSAKDVGYYFAAYKLAGFINMFTLAVGTLLFPTVSALHSMNDISGIKRLIFRSERYLSMIVFPMVFGIVILAEPTVFILISDWKPAIPILQILPFFVLFAALERPYQSQFLGMGLPKIARNRVIIMVCVNVFLNIILIPKDIKSLGINLAGLGAKGAAIATVISYFVGLLYSRIIAWKLNKIKGNMRILIYVFAAGVMALILYFLKTIIIIDRWYILLGFALVGFGIYMFILYLFNEFTKEDFTFFLDALNTKKMGKYIKDEIKKNK